MTIQPFDVHGDRLALGKGFEKWLETFERELKYNWCSPESETKADVAQMGLLIYAGNDVEDLHKPVYLNQLNRRESRGGTQIMKISKRGENLKKNFGVGETKRGGKDFQK